MNLEFRKKPVVIEAFQMTRERRLDNKDWPEWLNEAWNKNEGQVGAVFRKDTQAELPDLLCIWTLEGVHLVDWDDWIIRGVKGELYPCKPDIFAATYEAVETDKPAVQDEPVATVSSHWNRNSGFSLCDFIQPLPPVGTKLYTRPQPASKPMPAEQDRALCEAYCNAASDEYFNARPHLDTQENRRIFYAGHRKAWITIKD